MITDAMASLFQYVTITSGMTVRVSVNFMPDQSRVSAGRWFWVYHIRIENGRDETVQLLTRHWRITDERGMVNVVEGEGVVGEMPVLASGQTHDYVSGCELTTSSGSMEGHYTFAMHNSGGQADSGEERALFEVAIPHFTLAAPEAE